MHIDEPADYFCVTDRPEAMRLKLGKRTDCALNTTADYNSYAPSSATCIKTDTDLA